MKVLDFLNEAWLRGLLSKNNTTAETLINLQEFATNENAEVYACATGLVVADLHNEEKPENLPRGAWFAKKNGQLYFVSHQGIVPLTGEESSTDCLRLARAFIGSKNYYLTREGVERFKQHYQNGVFNNDPSEPNQ